MGLQRPLQDVAVFPERLQVRSALTGHELAALPLGATAVERYGAAYATIHRADLHGLLLAAVGKYTDTQFHLDHAIDRFTDAEGVVTVRTSRGKDVEGDALLGADGLWSRIRTQLLGEQHPRVSGHHKLPRLVPQALPRRCAPATSLRGWGRACRGAVPCAGAAQNLVVIVRAPRERPGKLGPRGQRRA